MHIIIQRMAIRYTGYKIEKIVMTLYMYVCISTFKVLKMRRRIKYAKYDVHYMKRM